jgi:hypothetical protein
MLIELLRIRLLSTIFGLPVFNPDDLASKVAPERFDRVAVATKVFP